MSAVERAAALLGDLVRRDAPLGALTTYRVGGPAALLVEPRNEDDLRAVQRAATESGVAVLVVGRGSNLLVADRGFAGLAVVIGDGFDEIAIDGTTVRAGGGVALPVLARRTAQAGLTGLEWAVGVPGSVGGAVRMNAGGHGAETRDSLARVRLVDLAGGADGERAAADLDLGYRRSNVAPTQVVVWAEFALAEGDADRSLAEIADVVRWRRENQPGGSNGGSVFANPDGGSAGRLIDECGLKGLRVGSAFVSPKHANFFQADEGGSADDVRALIAEVQARVEERTGIRLEPELRLVGFDGGGAAA